MQDTNLKLENYIVVCIDILGFKKACLSKKDDYLAELVATTNNAYSKLNNNDDKECGNEIAYYKNWQMKTYSDNILLVLPRYPSDALDSQMGHIFHGVASFQFYMIEHGFFVRGGIAIGEFYMDDNIAFGPALIKAYEAESQIAIYPRIILDQSVADLLKPEIMSYGIGNYHKEYIADFDGHLFLNYLSQLNIYLKIELFLDLLKKHKQVININLTEFSKDHKIWGKYMWAAQYHNNFCHEVFHKNKVVTNDPSEFFITF